MNSYIYTLNRKVNTRRIPDLLIISMQYLSTFHYSKCNITQCTGARRRPGKAPQPRACGPSRKCGCKPGCRPQGLARQQERVGGAGIPAQPSPASQSPANAQMPKDARQAPDGNFYVPDPNRPGKYLKVSQ